MTSLVNIYHKSEYDVYIGRPGRGEDGYYGNPEDLKKHNGDRDACLRAYRKYFYDRLDSDSEFKIKIQSLRGKRLGCFCLPQKCHGMIIIEYLDGISVEDQMAALSSNDAIDFS
jgi:hypothetical protein